MKIQIDPELQKITPSFKIGVLIADVVVTKNHTMDNLIQEFEQKLPKEYSIEDVVNIPIIKDGRDAYKKYGKDPSRYRLAVESLYRRIVKGNTLYRINNVVDLGNVLSLQTKKSIAVLDYNQIQGDVIVRLGTEMDNYEGIGRGKINIAQIPLYEDNIGPFGSTTSDTERTKITNKTTRILILIISFSGMIKMEEELIYARRIYEEHASAQIVDLYTIL